MIFLSFLGIQENNNTDKNEFFRHIIYPLLGKTDDDLEQSSLVQVIKDAMEIKVNCDFSCCPDKPTLTPVATVDEVIQAVFRAKREKKTLRVAGAQHSASAAIFPEDGVTLQLRGDLRKVEIQRIQWEFEGTKFKKWLYCRIGGGCYLGIDPMDPSSTLENSACYQVAIHGFGFPELGGITYQSVGGFISTGSAGGSLKHSFCDVIREIEFVDGNGQLQVAKPGTDLWAAVGVSMGLFGVVTYVSFRLPKITLVEGSEEAFNFADSMLGPNNGGKSKLKESLQNHEYMRVNWFPQKKVKRVRQWVGKRTSNGKIIPYKSIVSNILAAGMAAIGLAICNCLLQGKHPATEIDYDIIGGILKIFVPLNEVKRFRDKWFKVLPMDNGNHTDTILRIDFTEIWIPIDQSQTVMDKLLKLFENQEACGNLPTEIYGAKESPFWLSMSYNQKMVRVDPYWWYFNKGDKRQFFSYFWDVLLDIPGTRLHWGKYLPLPGQVCGKSTFNLAYLKGVYPKMDDWLKMRERMDPDQVFVTEYWRDILEIPSPSTWISNASYNTFL